MTLVELCVAIAVVGILISLLLVAIQATRESARKISCANNLRQVGLAIQNYVSQNHVFPPGGGGGFSFHVRILPFLGETNRYNQVDFGRRGEDQVGDEWAHVPSVITCPSDPFTYTDQNVTSTNYIGISGGGPGANYNGTIVAVSRKRDLPMVSPSYITDGLSNTLVVTEASAYLRYGTGEASSDRRAKMFHTPRAYTMPDELDLFASDCFSSTSLSASNTGLGAFWTEPSTGVTKLDCIFPKQPRNCANLRSKVNALFAPSSLHSNGVYCAFADGSISILQQTIDASVWQSLGSRNDGKVIDESAFRSN